MEPADVVARRQRMWAFLLTGLLVLISLWYIKVNVFYVYLVAYIWFGFAYGMMLQYGRFCFASASRDLFVAGVPRMAVGILVALIFFSLVAATLSALDLNTFHAAPLGIHTVISGIIFGFGMVLAGGCASGSLYKIGEGNGTSLLAIAGISFGQAIFVTAGGFLNRLLPSSWIASSQAKTWVPREKVTSWFDTYLTGYVWDQPAIQLSHTKLFSALPGAAKFFVGDALVNTVLPAALLLVVIYAVWVRKGFLKKWARTHGGTGLSADLAGLWSMITASKRTTLMGVLIGITAGLHIMVMKGLQLKFGVNNFGELLTRMGYTADVSIFGTVFDPGYWYITTQEAQLGAWILERFGFNMRDNVFFGVNNGLPALWRNPALWMSFGIILGAMAMALLNREFKFKAPKGELIAWGLLGGLLMGLGSRPALGCNIGAFFIRVAGGDPGGWLFMIGMVTGVFAGVKFFNWWTERKMAAEAQACDL